ncbi:MAG TPA: hypothetical protein DEP87_00675 [Candidatus Pacebacteria bacterium]|nr:hypothetical protein [Candidatus Paceibacterota bacterium]
MIMSENSSSPLQLPVAQSPIAPTEPISFRPPTWLISVVALVGGLIVGFGTRSWLSGAADLPQFQPNPVAEVSGQKTQTTTEASQTSSLDSVRFFTQADTNRLAFPVTQKGILRSVSIQPGDLVLQYADEVVSSSGAQGLGENTPLAAPDLSKIALITKTGEFRIVNAEGKLLMSAGSNFKADYITSWSPDSSAVIFHVESPTLMTTLFHQGMGSEILIQPGPKFDANAEATGFYLVDLATQKFSQLTPLNEALVLEWIDRSRLLVSVKAFGTSNETYAVFNLDTYQAEAAPYKEVFKNLFAPQISFGQNGRNWAISLHQSSQGTAGTNTVKIILAEFPSLTGKIIAEDGFAMVQKPILSPTETKVIYQGHAEVNGTNFVFYFDGAEAKKLFEGVPLFWIDDQNFVYANFNPSLATNLEMATKYSKYDVVTQKTTELYQVPVAAE